MANNITQISRVTNVSGGALTVDYPVSTGTENGVTPATGMLTWSDLRVATGGSATVQCKDVTTAPADLPGLGYTFETTATTGNGSGTTTLTMNRIVDSTSSLFGTVCTTANAKGTKVCGSYP
jgi:hypothetical protein